MLIDGLLRPGIFETWMVNSQGEKLFAEFCPQCGRRRGKSRTCADTANCKRSCRKFRLTIRTAEAVSGTGLNSPEAAHSTLLMGLLACLLMVEQLLGLLGQLPRTAVHRSSSMSWLLLSYCLRLRSHNRALFTSGCGSSNSISGGIGSLLLAVCLQFGLRL